MNTDEIAHGHRAGHVRADEVAGQTLSKPRIATPQQLENFGDTETLGLPERKLGLDETNGNGTA